MKAENSGKKSHKTLAALGAGLISISSISANAITYGVNYNWHGYIPANCPQGEILTAFMHEYSPYRLIVLSQLQTMRSNGVDALRVFVGWGDNYEAAAQGSFGGALISPPTTSVPDAYFSNVRAFLEDAKSSGIKKIILSLGGAGSYNPSICGNDQAVLVIPTYKNAITKLMSAVIDQAGQNISIKIDLANEIAPSDYEPQCSSEARTNFIKAIWAYYSDNYGTERASFSSILDDSVDPHIAANRLANLIETIAFTGKGFPSWFEVHAYGSSNVAINMLRGVYQTYSDHGFLSNSNTPKETIIGEAFYEDTENALGINTYLNVYDGFNGGKISLTGIFAWPLTQPAGCAQAVNIPPPYTTVAYRNTIGVIFQNSFDTRGF